MRQFVLTRSSFGPAWDLAANRQRLGMSKAVTTRLMAAQTQSDWTWLVLLDERDPLLRERLALYGDSAPHFVPLVWLPPRDVTRAAARVSVRPALRSINAVAAHQAPWRDYVGPADDIVLMTRLDDDDGLARDALARVRAAAEGLTKRTILMLPVGIWTWRGRYAQVRHERNAMHTLVTPPGDCSIVYGYSHAKCDRFAPVVIVDNEVAWLWVRHTATISSARHPTRWGGPPVVLTRAVRSTFPVDWRTVVRGVG